MPRAPITPKPSRFILLASICVVVAALYWMQDVLIPLALSILLTFLLTPLIGRLERTGVNRVGSVVLVTVVGLALVGVLGYVVADQVVALAGDLPQYKSNLIDKVTALRGGGEPGAFSRAAETLKDVSAAIDEPATTRAAAPTTLEARIGLDRAPDVPREPGPNAAAAAEAAADVPLPGTSEDKPIWTIALPPPRSALELLGANLAFVLGPVGTAGLVLVFLIFMLIEREHLRDRLIRLVGQGQLQITTRALDDAAGRISRYLLAQAIVNGTYGLAIAIGLEVIGLSVAGEHFPNFVLWGLLCAVLRFVPYVGPWIAAVFPIVVSIAVFPGYGVFIATAAMFVIVELLSNNVMEPWLYGSSTGMSAVAILVSAVFWTFLWGPIGLVLATPMTVCLVVLGKYVPQLAFLDILLGDEPVLSPAERVYQRLLAMDQEEASEVAREYLEEMRLEQVYDTVLMPALGMAEQDRHRGKLDDDQRRFIRQTMKDLIDELGDLERERDEARQTAEVKAGAAAVEAAARGDGAVLSPGERTGATDADNGRSSVDEPPVGGGRARPRLPKECVANVLCLPAHDEADEIVGLMLAQVLQHLGYCAFPQSVEKLASEMVEQIESKRAHVVVVSAMPPAAVTHSRYLCKRIHARFPNQRMIVGLWTFKGDLKKAKDRVTCAGSVTVLTTLADALDEIRQQIQPLLLDQGAETRTSATAPGGA